MRTCSGELLWKVHGPLRMLMKMGISRFRKGEYMGPDV
jgi:hypothetical protein